MSFRPAATARLHCARAVVKHPPPSGSPISRVNQRQKQPLGGGLGEERRGGGLIFLITAIKSPKFATTVDRGQPKGEEVSLTT